MIDWIVRLADNSLHNVSSNKRPKAPEYTGVYSAPIDGGTGLPEDARWLQIEAVEVQDGVFEDRATVDSAAKTTIQAADAQAVIDQAALDAHEDLIKIKLARQEFGKRIKAEVAVLNDSLGWTVAQTVAYMGNDTIRALDALAMSGSLTSLKDELTLADLSQFYTAAEKQSIIDLIQNYLDNE